MRPCETCDFTGPELDTLEAALREVHRAAHDLYRHTEPPIASLADLMLRVVIRDTRHAEH